MDLPPNKEYICSSDVPFGTMTEDLLDLLKYTETERIFKVQASGNDNTVLMLYCDDSNWKVEQSDNSSAQYKIEKIPLSRGFTFTVNANNLPDLGLKIDKIIFNYIKTISRILIEYDNCDNADQIYETIQLARMHMRKETGNALGNCIFYGNKDYKNIISFPYTLIKQLDWLNDSILIMESSGTCDSSLVLVPETLTFKDNQFEFIFHLIPNNLMKYFKLINVTNIEKKEI